MHSFATGEMEKRYSNQSMSSVLSAEQIKYRPN